MAVVMFFTQSAFLSHKAHLAFDIRPGGEARTIVNGDHSPSTAEPTARRLVLVGGFLGAGKATLIGQFSRYLKDRGLKVGLVTNDQGEGLMNTDSAYNSGAQGVEEITGGCFCCRLDDLVGAVHKLDEAARPDVIVAEPVGSCTDLMATVILPLERVYHLPFALSPLSVIVDARRVLTALGGKRQARDFHRDVGYVFRKQLEEAMCLSRKDAELILKHDRRDSFAGVFAPDEAYFATVLASAGVSPLQSLANRAITWTEWEMGKPHPREFLTVRPSTAAQIVDSGCFFARKFPSGSDIGRWELHRARSAAKI